MISILNEYYRFVIANILNFSCYNKLKLSRHCQISRNAFFDIHITMEIRI